MQLQTISLSMMCFDDGPLMSDDAHMPPCELTGSLDLPTEADFMLSMVSVAESIMLDDYRGCEPARRAG